MRPGEKIDKSSSSAQLKDAWLKVRLVASKRFGFVFIIMSLVGLIYAAYNVQQALQDNSALDSVSPSKDWSSNFSKITIDKINSLGTKSTSPLPQGRTNPFAE